MRILCSPRQKWASFLNTLSPEQLSAFQGLAGASPTPPSPVAPAPTPSPPPNAVNGWYNQAASSATETEVLVLAALLAVHPPAIGLEDWALEVESDAELCVLLVRAIDRVGW